MAPISSCVTVRLFLVTLALLSLAVRWADAGCGCAEHNGWVALATHAAGEHAHEHDAPAGPALDHGCSGECGEAVYAAGDRVQMSGPVAVLVAAVCAPPSAFRADSPEGLTPSGPTPSRAALKVYRV